MDGKVKNLIRKQNRNTKHVHRFIIATGFLYMNYVTKIKSLSVRAQLDSIYSIQIQVKTYKSNEHTNLMQHCAGFISAGSFYMFRAQAPIIRSI